MGNVSKSAANFPKIKNLEYLKNFIKNPAIIEGIPFELEDALELHQSFFEKTANIPRRKLYLFDKHIVARKYHYQL